MAEQLEYKGYAGSADASYEDDLLYGKILGVPGLYSYEGSTLEELTEGFRKAVEEIISGSDH